MTNSIYKNNNLIIYNILRKLGIRPNNRGIIFIMQAIQIVTNKDNEDIIIINDVYVEISKHFKECTPLQIRKSIQYALRNRNEEKSKINFESIFGYEYDEDIFTNKDFIEEITRIIRMNFN